MPEALVPPFPSSTTPSPTTPSDPNVAPPFPTAGQKVKTYNPKAAAHAKRLVADQPFTFKPGERELGFLGEMEIRARNNAISVGDMMLAIPGMFAGVVGDVVGRWVSLATGGTAEQSAEFGRDMSKRANALNAEGIRLIHEAIGAPSPQGTTVNNIMDWMMKASERVAVSVEKGTEGMVKASTIDSLRDGIMSFLAARGIRSDPKAIEKEIGKAQEDTVRKAAQADDPQRTSDYYKDKTKEQTHAARANSKNLVWNAADGVWEEEAPPLALPAPTKRLTGPKDTTEAAVDKMAKGGPKDMTADERAAYQAWVARGRPGIKKAGFTFGDEGRGPKETTPEELSAWEGEGGRVAMMALVGVGTALGAYYLSPETRREAVAATAGAFILRGKDGRGLDLPEFEALPDTSSMKALVEKSDTTTRTQERLATNFPGNTSFTKKQVLQEAAKAGANKEELATVTAALARAPGDRLSAKDFVVNMKKEMGDYALTPKEVDTWADYGLTDGTGLDLTGQWVPEGEEGDPNTQFLPQPKTTLYLSPPSVGLPESPHMDHPNVFGWTRGFHDEQGVWHVVELQTELEKKLSTEEERASLEEERAKLKPKAEFIPAYFSSDLFAEAKKELIDFTEGADPETKREITAELLARTWWKTPEEAISAVREGSNGDYAVLAAAVSRVTRAARIRLAEIDAALSIDPPTTAKIKPLFSIGFARRLVYEELSRAQTGQVDPTTLQMTIEHLKALIAARAEETQ